jgi:hexosaminidase
VREKGGSLPEVSEKDGKSSREHYKLTVSGKGVRVEAETSAGLYYAVQTLRQLVTGVGKTAFVPGVVIEDRPRLTYRGVMMDFAHGGLPTVAEVKKQIDFLALWKTNQYYFYNEVSIELKGYPTVAYQLGLHAGANQKHHCLRKTASYGCGAFPEFVRAFARIAKK